MVSTWISLSSLLASLPTIAALLVNRTIDDESGDSVTGVRPVYGPSFDPGGSWVQGSVCVHCTMLPGKVVDVSQTFEGTWHDSTYHPGQPDHTIDANFTGTAIYVYFIVPNFVPSTTTLVNLTFWIDSTYYNQYEHAPDSTATIMYQVLVFYATNLAHTNHSIGIRASGPSASILLFDYMEYTTEEVDPNPSPLSSGPQAPSQDMSASSLPTSTSFLPTSTSESTSFSPQPTPTTSPLASPASSSVSPSSAPPSQRNTQSSSSLPTTVIAGGITGGAIVLSLLSILYYFLRRRHGRSANPVALMSGPRLGTHSRIPSSRKENPWFASPPASPPARPVASAPETPVSFSHTSNTDIKEETEAEPGKATAPSVSWSASSRYTSSDSPLTDNTTLRGGRGVPGEARRLAHRAEVPAAIPSAPPHTEDLD